MQPKSSCSRHEGEVSADPCYAVRCMRVGSQRPHSRSTAPYACFCAQASAISCMVAAFMCVAPATAFSCSRSVALPQLRASFQSCSLRGRETSRQIHHAYGTNLLSMVEPVVVTLKIAVDSKGAVDDLGLTAKRFTCSESLDAVHRLRRDSDAVLVGVGTVARDDPSLTVRRVTPKDGDVQPSRVVIDPYLRIPPNSVLLRDGIHTVIACSEASSLPRDLFDALSVPTAAKVELFRLPDRGPGQSLELQLLLNALAERGMKEIM
eukprot:2247963-Rhodomonas_salina.3